MRRATGGCSAFCDQICQQEIGWLDQLIDVEMPITNRPQHQLGSSAHTIALSCGFNIFMNGVLAEREYLRDLPVAFALRDQRDAVDLARAERNWLVCDAVTPENRSRSIKGRSPNQAGGHNILGRKLVVAAPG